jgi:acetyl esterase/lipase
MVHGGYWRVGSLNEFHNTVRRLQPRLPKYAFVSVGYRLFDGKQHKFPTQEEDVARCIEYVLTNRNRFGVSDDFALYGTSAGAHLAMLYAYRNESACRPKALVNISGVTDILPIFKLNGFQVLQRVLMEMAGNPFTADSLKFINSSPLRQLHGTSVPTLIIHGEYDTIIPLGQSEKLLEKLKDQKVPCEFIKLRQEGHDFRRVQKQLERDVAVFLKKYLN